MAVRSPHPLRNGETPLQSPDHRDYRFPSPNPQFRSTVTEQKLRRFNTLIFVFRLTSFSFSLASSVFMLTNTRGGGDGAASSDSPHWYEFDTFRLVLAANGIVALYSLIELGATVWEISRNLTLLPEVLQVWFDFGHDQVFAYLLLSACSSGASLAKTMRKMDTCMVSSAFCLQADISITLGFIAFLFLGLTSLLSGFRVVCFIINGSRFHL